MAVYDPEEQQKIEDLKAWWTQNGKYVSLLVTAACLVIIGFQGWRWYQRTQAEGASVLYQAVSQALAKRDTARAKDAMKQLADKYSATGYAARGALLTARLLFETNDKAGAREQLKWAADHAGEEELKYLAQYRLAQVLFDEKNFTEALKVLDAQHPDAFAGTWADLRGDLLVAAGRPADARSAYQTALAKLDPKSTLKTLVQVKLDALGGPS